MEYRKEPLYLDPKYAIDTNGVIYGVKGQPLKGGTHTGGYPTVLLCINGVSVQRYRHILVARQFIGEPPSEKHQVLHKDGNRLNVNVDNLAWVLPHERVAHNTRVLQRPTGRKSSQQVYAVHKRTGEIKTFDSYFDAAKHFVPADEITAVRRRLASAVAQNQSVFGYFWCHENRIPHCKRLAAKGDIPFTIADVENIPYPFNFLVLSEALPHSERFVDLSATETVAFENEISAWIDDLFNDGERAYRIFRAYFHDNKSQQEIAEAEGLTDGRVWQILAKIRMKFKMYARYLRNAKREKPRAAAKALKLCY